MIHEDTSALYGTLVTVMLEHAFTGGHSTTLDRLRSAVVVHYRTTYTRALLEQAGFDAESIDTLGPEVDMRGISGIALERFARSQGRLVVPSQHESRFRECLALADQEDKSPAVFMYFTALQQALESSVFFRWRQIGRDLSAYASFVEDAPLQVAVARGLELIQSLSRRGTTSVRFEVPVVFSVDDTIVRRIHEDHLKDASQVADRIFGAVDVLIGDDDGDDEPLFVEIKFTSALEADHVLQLGMYLSMQALNTDRIAKGLLVNLRTGEQRTMKVAPEDARSFIAHTLAAPLEPRPRRSAQESLEAEEAEETEGAEKAEGNKEAEKAREAEEVASVPKKRRIV